MGQNYNFDPPSKKLRNRTEANKCVCSYYSMLAILQALKKKKPVQQVAKVQVCCQEMSFDV